MLGSEQEIVLRNKETRGLKRIRFRVVPDIGPSWLWTRAIRGEIFQRDGRAKHCELLFRLNPNQNGVTEIAAQFCAPIPRNVDMSQCKLSAPNIAAAFPIPEESDYELPLGGREDPN